jgi:hypothetical protein
MGLAIMIVAYAALVWVGLRLIVLFPAIAVRTEGTIPGHAFDDTKDYGPRLLAILVPAFIPPIALGLLITLGLGPGIMVRGSMLFVIGEILSALIGTFVTALGVVIAAPIFLTIGRTAR